MGVAYFRDVRGFKNSTYVQLLIPVSCVTFLGFFVFLLPGSSVAGLGALEDSIIPPALKSVLLLTAC